MKLKVVRVLFANIFLVLFSVVFLLSTPTVENISKFLTKHQFVPMVIVGFGFIFLTIVTCLFGRVYCSFICPTGISIDIINSIANIFKNKRKKRLSSKTHKKNRSTQDKTNFKWFKKYSNAVRYIIMLVFFVCMFLGVMTPVALLEPYSIFGRFLNQIFMPIFILLNNIISKIFMIFGSYSISIMEYRPINLVSFLIIFGTLLFIVFVSLLHGRWYCNKICPVGSLLGFISKYFNGFRININENCTKCKACQKQCYSKCIDLENKNIVQENCVACFNCIPNCKFDAISYKVKPMEGTEGRRGFLNSGLALFGLFTALMPFKLRTNAMASKWDIKTKNASPPGSRSVARYMSLCTSCYLCVSKCPSNVLQPSKTFQNDGWVLQPYMDYKKAACEFECNICSQVCPTAAIAPTSLEVKKTIKIGDVKFVRERCVVITEKNDCGACAEHCPTKAVYMIPIENGLYLPETNDNLCIGCGFCESVCPVKEKDAIFINPLSVHKIAEPVKENQSNNEEPSSEWDNEFPF